MTALREIKQTWEWRALRVLLRAIFYCFFIAYVIGASDGAWSWLMREYYRAVLEPPWSAHILAAVRNENPEKAAFLYAVAPAQETVKRELEEHAGILPPEIFLTYMHTDDSAGKIEDAAFWLQYARFRLRYDALRCKGAGIIDYSNKLANIVIHSDVERRLNADKNLVRRSLKRALDFDAAHPATNDPVRSCARLMRLVPGAAPGVMPREDWESLRLRLRATAEAFLAGETVE